MASGWGAVGGGAWSGNPGWGASEQDNAPTNPQQQAPAQYSAPNGHSVPVPHPAAPPPASAPPPSQSFNRPPPAPPPVNPAAQANLQAREQQLAQREAQLAQREAQLKEYAAQLESQGKIEKPKNWPFPCYGILHHDISGEIPEKSRRPVREGYIAWLGLVLCLVWNLFCASVMLGSNSSVKVSSWFLAVLYFVLGIPLGFYLWYWRLYNGAKADSTLSFVGFFINFFIHTAFCIYAAIAPSIGYGKWCFAGFLSAFQAFDFGDFEGVIYLVGAGLWTAEAVLSVWIMRDVWYYFRGQGGVQQVKQEAALATFRANLQAAPAANSNRV